MSTKSTLPRKEFKLTSFSIDNRISVMVLLTLITVLGIVSYITIPKESFPNITVPNVFIVTIYPGVSPEDMESLITRKLEDELKNITGIKEMRSTSSEGYSSINIEFDASINIDEALQKVREKVDLAKPELPSEADDSIIQEVNFSEFPIMQVNISGEYSLDKLKDIAEDLQEKLEGISSVLEVELTGGLEREVQIDVDLPRMKYYGISFDDIIKAVANENLSIPGGDISVGNKKFLLRVPGQYEEIAPIEDIVVKGEKKLPIYLRDLATVKMGFKERETYSTLDDAPVITLGVKKRSGENILQTTAAVTALLETELPKLPPTTTYKITNDQSKHVRSMVSNLENNIISGLLLVVGVLLFFLGARNSSFVGISIPTSMFMSFILLTIFGITMNMVVLFSLILALGMLVDNAIVVVENIYRYLEEGYSNFEAAKKGTGEVAVPIISGTLTTVAAFFPMVFWPGLTGEFMSYLPKTVIITLLSSLFVGLVINPVICALYMRLETEENPSKLTRAGKMVLSGVAIFLLLPLIILYPVSLLVMAVLVLILYVGNRFVLNNIGSWWQQKGLPAVLKIYGETLEQALNHKALTLVSAVLIFVSSIFLLIAFNPGTEFFPENIPPADLYVQIETPIGSDVQFTKNITEKILGKVKQLPQIEDIVSVLATSGSVITADPMNQGGGNSSHKATVALNFKDFQERENDVFEVLEFMRAEFGKDIAGAKISVEQPNQGPPVGKPISLEIAGAEMPILKKISEDIIQIIETDPVFAKLDRLESDLPDSRPELQIIVDREKASLYELNTNSIGSTIRQAMNGVEASKFRDGKDEYDITVRLSDEYRKDMNTLADLTVFHEGKQIPLSEVATWKNGEGLGGIRHLQSERVITISSDVRSNFQDNAVLEEVKLLLQPYLESLPGGYSFDWTGQQQDQQEAFDFLGRAFLIAIFSITFILVSQFNSLVKPLIVMSSVVMSIAGVLFGLVAFQMAFGLMAFIGIISLAGVVVNNAIVLIDYVDILRERDGFGLREALIEGGKIRFRPVILTAITTTLGLVPLATGFNFDFLVLVGNPAEFFSNLSEYVYMGGEQAAWWGPMAISVIVGLLFSTAITLILVPVLYSSFERARIKVLGALYKSPEVDISAIQPNGMAKSAKEIALQDVQ